MITRDYLIKKIMPISNLYPIPFAGNPLNRASAQRTNSAWIEDLRTHRDSLFIPLYQGDPLIVDKRPGFLAMDAVSQFEASAPIVLLGLDQQQRAYFTLDASASAPAAQTAPFSDIGDYVPLRTLAEGLEKNAISANDLAILGQARWLLDWHRRNQFCAVCATPTSIAEGGAKRHCTACESDHFPRNEPVAIVLAYHEDACLLGRSPHFPPGFLSTLAGFAEAGESLEECAVRELYEEAGVEIYDLEYQFSQPWPFPASLMMGYFAKTKSRDLVLDKTEIEDAKWITRKEIRALLNGDQVIDVFIPPSFTIARHLIERWAKRDP